MTREELMAKVAWWMGQANTMDMDDVLNLLAAVVDLLPEDGWTRARTYTVTGLTSATNTGNIPHPGKTMQDVCEQVMPPQMNVKEPAKDRTKGEQVAAQFDLSLKTGIGWLSGHTVELAKAIDAALAEQRAALEKEHADNVAYLGAKATNERNEALGKRDNYWIEHIRRIGHDQKDFVDEVVRRERARIADAVEKTTIMARTPTGRWVDRADVFRAINPPPA